MQAFSYSDVTCCGLACFGKGKYNNVEVYGTTRHPYDSFSAKEVVDVVSANYSKNEYNNCKFGKFYSQSGAVNKFYNTKVTHLHLTGTKAENSVIGAGCEVGTLLLGAGYEKPDGTRVDRNTTAGATIETGAVIDVLDLSILTNNGANVVVKDGAIIKKILYGGNEYSSWAEFKASLQ